MRTKPGLSMYRDNEVDVVVRDLPNGRPAGPAVILRHDVVVVLPLRWNTDNELEVLLGEHDRYAVDHPRVTESPSVRLEPHERDPFHAARTQLGAPEDRQTLLMSDVLTAPDFTDERWHLIIGFDMHGVEDKVPGRRWRTLRAWLTDMDKGLIRDAKTMLALLMLQRRVETVAVRANQDR